MEIMQQQEIHSYLKNFFTTNNCTIEQDNGKYMTVQLTIEMDKLLMNRPFYWHYIEKIGAEPNPQKITFITDFNELGKTKGELIHFGSPRLHQIFNVIKKQGGFIRLFENKSGSPNLNVPLYPWLCLNVKISYICDHRKDRLQSYGVNLMNGTIIYDFHDQLFTNQIHLVAKMPDFAFTFTPLIKPQSGIRRIKQLIENEIATDDHTWAEDAKKRWAEDAKLLDAFFEDEEERPERYYIEKEALKNQYEPKIHVSIINGGIFYLTQHSLIKK
jgi:hypothetical protein